MAQESRMNLVKVILKKILNHDDTPYSHIDELLEKATNIVREWRQNQPQFDSATPKKYIPESASLVDEDPTEKNIEEKQLGLSGFGDGSVSVSDMSHSFVGAPPDQIEANFDLKLDDMGKDEFEGEPTEGMTSIQDRLAVPR